jgi:hypothetical protein
MLITELFANEDWATTNMITNETGDFGDIITARNLISKAHQDPQNEQHRYLEFIKKLRKAHGIKYSTMVHKQASRLAREAA